MKKKAEIKQGVLPEIILEGKAFNLIRKSAFGDDTMWSAKNLSLLYFNTNNLMPNGHKVDNKQYKKYYNNPKKHVNGAFLDRKQKNPEKWLIIIKVMQEALLQTIIEIRQQSIEAVSHYQQKNKECVTFLTKYKKSINDEYKK